ncbi:glycosyl hydrolase family 3 N terminal domain-containing protein [Fusarium mundagurra]|uniref:Probable beta-glucosidase I n=1 Tax=Fusarium mundagurra TaxID=1567541 RepID=A0A8H6D9H4_9HYPO|nr:glycosyl hydrolase family 3 N terminal domain-containing protein [Fusarium mundagurra]
MEYHLYDSQMDLTVYEALESSTLYLHLVFHTGRPSVRLLIHTWRPNRAGYKVKGAVVGLATLKHFVCNDMEHQRMAVDVMVTQRAMREIHLMPSMLAISIGKPEAIMTAYNMVNGFHGSESKTLLQDILRNEWKFDGLVMSDWFGIYSTTESIQPGLDLEMPDQALLRRAASEYIALLKNNNNILPFANSKTTAVIGPNAKIALSPYQGISKQSKKKKTIHERLLTDSNLFLLDYEHPDRAPVWYSQREGILTPDKSGLYDFGLSDGGTGKLYIDDQLLISNVKNQKPGAIPFGSGTVEEMCGKEPVAGQYYRILVKWGCTKTSKLTPSCPVGEKHGGWRFGACKRMDPVQPI